MNHCLAILSLFATAVMAETSIRKLHYTQVDVASNIQLLAFSISLTTTGSPNKGCGPDEDSDLKLIIKRALDNLGASGLGLEAGDGATFSVVDIKLESEKVTDASELDEDEKEETVDLNIRHRRLAGSWVYQAAASCYMCIPNAEHEKKNWKGKEVGHTIVVPASAIDTMHAAVAHYFESNELHCMASKSFAIDMEFHEFN